MEDRKHTTVKKESLVSFHHTFDYILLFVVICQEDEPKLRTAERSVCSVCLASITFVNAKYSTFDTLKHRTLYAVDKLLGSPALNVLFCTCPSDDIKLFLLNLDFITTRLGGNSLLYPPPTKFRSVSDLFSSGEKSYFFCCSYSNGAM